MRIEGAGNTGIGVQAGMPQGNDAISKSIQSRIQSKEQEIQKLAENENLSSEEKMKKRQEIQKEINELNKQLRQHQMDMRRQQQQERPDSMDKMLGDNNSGVSKDGMLSQASMKAMVSADSSMKQVRAQESTATKLEGDARNLKAEIRTDLQRGDSVEGKKEALQDLEERVSNIRASEIGILSDAVSEMKDAKEEENAVSREEGKKTDEKENTSKAEEKDAGEVKAAGEDEKAADAAVRSIPDNDGAAEKAESEVKLPVNYTSVNILL